MRGGTVIPNHFCVIPDKTSFSEAKLLRFYGKISKKSHTVKVRVKTSFNYCSSGSGQNYVIPVVWNVPEKIIHTTC